MTENNRFSGRIKRYIKFSTKMGGLATRYLGPKIFGIQPEDREFASELTKVLGDLKGPVMKIAQILSTVPDMMPKEYVEEMTELQSNAPPMGWLFVKRRMRSELGEQWQSKFQSFEKQPFAAASLGQVHKAVDLSGNLLACKLQYPDMSSVIEADLFQLRFALSIYKRYQGALDTQDVFDEISDRLREELDYVNEARNMQIFQEILKGDLGVRIPKVHEDLSTGRLLIMDLQDGEKLAQFNRKSQAFRDKVAKNIFRSWYKPFYQYGILHGDPHLGNYSANLDGSINLYDFGCVRVFEPKLIEGVINLYRAFQNNDHDLMVDSYEKWGFKNLTKEIIEILNLWAEYLYEPLMEDKKRLINEELSSNKGKEIASIVHKKLREIGGIKPPRSFVFLDRAAVGLGAAFMRLEAKLNWHNLFHELIEGFEIEKVRKNQQIIIN
jgi:predicted unusual protein kinase regulating ubiquinone biosynthesis (AarF/ABC1/UbiB family)